MIDRIEITKRFINYTTINTTGVEGAPVPSCKGQLELAKLVLDELESYGCKNLRINESGIAFATLPATSSNLNNIALFAHLDTAPDRNTDTFAQIHENYQGGDIPFANAEGGLLVSENPHLESYIGDDIILTDGTSLLGADDKAAIASIVQSIKYFTEHPDVPHGEITVVLLPDEETGIRGAHALEVPQINADFGLCLDCCGIGEYVIENWFAANATIEFTGKTAHPMNAIGKLKNALIMAHELIGSLPPLDRPEHTKDKEGYFWAKSLTGDTSKAVLKMDIRDFDDLSFNARKELLITEIAHMNERFGYKCAEILIQDDYGNVKTGLQKNPKILSTIESAMDSLGIEKKPLVMRGGYDGSVITPKGLTTANIFTGAHNFHSVTEYLPVNSLVASCKMLINIISNATK